MAGVGAGIRAGTVGIGAGTVGTVAGCEAWLYSSFLYSLSRGGDRAIV